MGGSKARGKDASEGSIDAFKGNKDVTRENMEKQCGGFMQITSRQVFWPPI